MWVFTQYSSDVIRARKLLSYCHKSCFRLSSGNLRIIAGKWRRRRIRFDPECDIRPTTDAARETLFNWLQGKIEHAVCLDLFAGSGALSFEALSRGAKEVVLIDSDRRCVRSLHQNAAALQAQHLEIRLMNAKTYLRQADKHFDIVFVDPPFKKGLATQTLELLKRSAVLNPDACVYLEVEREFSSEALSGSWEIFRQQHSGSRTHLLLAPNEVCGKASSGRQT